VANFQYAAKDSGGKTVEGSIEAADQSEAIGLLRGQNLIVVRLEQGGKGKAKSKGSKGAKAAAGEGGGGLFASLQNAKMFKVKPSAKKEELCIFTRQLSTMIGAGISLLESLEVLRDQAEKPGMKATLEILCEELRGGSDLSIAMKRCPQVFNKLYISMVAAGEVSGQMDIILERLAEYVEASEELKREIKSAMTYPIISLVLVLGITAFLMIGVIPGFKDVFAGLGAELPALTTTVLAISDFMVAKWFVLVGVGAGAVIGIKLFKKTPQGQLFFDHLILKVPVFGPLFRKVALARFSRTFATLIRSGVPIMGTLDIVSETAGNQVISNCVDQAKDSVRNGNMLSEPLANSSVFPPMVVRMIAIGERSGALEALLEKIAEFYDSQVKATVKSLTSLIEPILICFMGGIVGVVILSVFLPILNVIGELS